MSFNNINNSNFLNSSLIHSQNSTFQLTNDSNKHNYELNQQHTISSSSVNRTAPLNLAITNNTHLNENVEDLSVLDLHDFEEFLNDKAPIDPSTIFNSVSSENILTNSNDINLTSNSISTSKSTSENQKNLSLSSKYFFFNF